MTDVDESWFDDVLADVDVDVPGELRAAVLALTRDVPTVDDAEHRGQRRHRLLPVAVAAATLLGIAGLVVATRHDTPQIGPADSITPTAPPPSPPPSQATTTVAQTTTPSSATTSASPPESTTDSSDPPAPPPGVVTTGIDGVVAIEVTASGGPGDQPYGIDAEAEDLCSSSQYPFVIGQWRPWSATTPDGTIRAHLWSPADDLVISIERVDTRDGCIEELAVLPAAGERVSIASGLGSLWLADGSSVLRRLSDDGTVIGSFEVTTELFAISPTHDPVVADVPEVNDVAVGFDALWIATNIGVVRLDPDTSEFAVVGQDQRNGVTDGSVTELAVGPDAVWARRNGRQVRIDPSRLEAGPGIRAPVSQPYESNLFVAGDRGVWGTAAREGVWSIAWHLDDATGAYTEFRFDPEVMTGTYIDGLVVINGNAWVAVGRGDAGDDDPSRGQGWPGGWLYKLDAEAATATRVVGLQPVGGGHDGPQVNVIGGDNGLVVLNSDTKIQIDLSETDIG